MSDPTYNKTAGVHIRREGQKWKTCSCGESILVGQVQDVQSGAWNWRVWDAMPIEHAGQRYYSKHLCPKAERSR